MKTLEGKIAFVTGAAMGNGEGIARVMAEKGATVILADKSEKVFETAASIGDAASPYVVELTDGEKVKEVAADVIAKFGRLDILVNNAGICRRIPIEQFNDDLWDLQYQVNVKTCYNCVKAFVPYMIEKRSGRIINMSSVSGPKVVDENVMAYAACKSAIAGFTKAISMDLAKYGITANTIMPGYILTPAVQLTASISNPENPQAALDATAARVPLGRLGTPRDIGYLAAFLASDEASYITGGEFVIDGGNMNIETGVMGQKKS